MGIGFKPDNTPKAPYNGGKEGRVVVKGFREEQINHEQVNNFINLFVKNLNDPQARQLAGTEYKRLTIEEGIDGDEIMVKLEKKLVADTVFQLKKMPIVIFSNLAKEKEVVNKFFNSGIKKERFGALLEKEILPLFVEQAKLLSVRNHQESVDMQNPQVIAGAKNLVDMGIKFDSILNATKYNV